MKFKTTIILILSVFAFTTLFAQQSYNYEEMTQEQYNAYLAEWQQRLDAAQQGIDEENARIEELQKELESLQGQVDDTWTEIFNITGQTKEDYEQYGNQLSQLRDDAQAFLNLSPEEIYRRMDELDDLQSRLDALKESAFGQMAENARLIEEIQSLINQAREKGEGATPPTYTVMRGDYLWKIAAKDDIYGDAYAWMRIYTANRNQIKDPDLIYPDQVFSIPRQPGPNEYWVKRGEHLSKIAGYSQVFGDPFKWQRLYEANKDVISDPNMIFPHQILKIAR